MKSKITKIQILRKGMAILLVLMFMLTPIAYATTSLDDSYLEGSILDQLLYGTIGSTVKEIEEWFSKGNTTLYITNETQLRALAEYVNDGKSCSGKEIILLNDIEVDKNNEWVPIGNENNPFKGTFDGNNFTISGIRISTDNKNIEEFSNLGLFGYISQGKINELKITDVYFDLAKNFGGDSEDVEYILNIGAIVGLINNGEITDCRTIGTDYEINGDLCVGGIAGKALNSKVKNSINEFKILSNLGQAGGIVGYTTGSIENCINKGKVTTDGDYVGGIAGALIGEIKNCLNKGGEIAGVSQVGGILGSSGTSNAESIIITNCINTGKVEGNESVGGIQGYTISKQQQIKNCLNKGNINGEKNVAGIIGYINDPNEKADIINCTNEGSLTGVTSIGGIVGRSLEGELNVEKCFNKGNITQEGNSLKWASGIVGFDTSNCNIKNCINSGDITGNGSFLAGITDRVVDAGTVENCINEGKIKNTKEDGGYAVGIVNLLSNNVTVKNCINSGQLTSNASNWIIGIVNTAENSTISNYANTASNVTKLIGTNTNSTITGENKADSSKIDRKSIGSYIKESDINAGNLLTLTENIGATNVTYTIYKNSNKISESTYLKAGDVIKVTVNFDKYLATSYGPLTAIEKAPVLKINSDIEMVAGKINLDESNYTTTVDYTYTIKDGDNFEITELNLSNIKNIYAIKAEDYDAEHNTYTEPTIINTNLVSTSISGINVDTTKPTINTKIYVENVLETERYTAGKEILFEVTTSEVINGSFDVPKIQVSFSESGIGKYNYNKETGKEGYAKCIEAKINLDGTTTWIFSYQVQEFDEGYVSVEYKAGEIEDLAGNITNLSETYKAEQADKTNLKQDGITITKVEVLKVDKKTLVDANEYISGKIYARVYVDPINLYSDINTKMNKETAPNLFLNGNIKQKDITKIDFENSYIEYEFNTENISKLIEVSMVSLINKVDLYTEDQLVSNAIPVGAQTDYEIDIFYIDDINFVTKESVIYADTTAPTVVITPNVQNSLTKEDTVTYEIKWSEELKEFAKEDITVNNGEVIELVKNEDGTYTATVKTSIEDGNVGDLQVIIEENACQDLVALGNVRTESVIRVDRKAPFLQTLEAYAESDIALNSEIDVVKEYYKTDEKITVVATFDENITSEKVPELVIQFNESGKSVVLNGEIEANKITYTYTIAEGDEGTVSVRAVNGTVQDAAGNSTIVTRKALDGNTIIVDTKAPSLNELNVITDEGTYNAGKVVTIEAIYDENVYALKDNEIKNISSETAPTLKVKFGNGEEREATFSGYAGEDKTKLIYTTTVVDTDNGKLSIVSYENKENVQVSDIAGNEAKLNNKQTGNEIIADNIRPVVENITAVVENPSISGTDIYYKEGNRIKITLTFSEEVSSNKLWPEILVGFSEEAGKEPTEYNTYAYESDWNVNSKTIEYSYTIRNGENGYLWVKVPEGQFRDAAGNTNIAKDAEEKLNVYADTIIPTVTLYRDTEETQNNQTITIKATFNENVYDLNGDRRVTLTTANAPKLIYSFGDGANREIGATSISGATITYTIRKDSVEDNGDLYYELAKGNLCDRAGNELYKTTLDTTAPVLESVVISSNAGIYAPYCKEGKDIYVIATFDEPIKAENIKLKAKVGEVEIAELLDGEIVEENDTKVKFTYTVKAGDMGVFKILDICGETDSKITEENADKTYGWVRDEHGNQNNIYSLEDEKVTATGKAEADTKDPYITSIKAVVDGEEIATYTKEEGKDAVITVGRTNENIVEYIVTYNEKIDILDKSKISIENGIIKSIEYTNFALNEFRIIVQTTVEGVQSLIINEATVEDKAGNTDEFVRLNAVTVDFTKPTVRFISEYNGGAYVLPTNIGKVEIRPNVEISEDIDTIEYKWDDEKDYIEIENYSSSSDIAVPTKAFTEAGTHTLYIKVVDLAGNPTETSKTYKILNSYIGISTDITVPINTIDNGQPVKATVSFGDRLTDEDVLTDNRKVTFKAEGSQEIVELNAAGVNEYGTQYDIWTNGTIYAEATDRVGNKVFTEYPITNIDNDAPEITFDEYYLTTLVNKEIEVGISLNESAKISYSWDNETWEETQEDVMFLDITKTFTEVGKYTLYVKAIDEAGNESSADIEIEVVNLSFEVLGNATEWTSNDVELYVYCEEELASITVNGENVNVKDRTYEVTANGEYEFVVTDKYGNAAVAIDSKGNVIEGNKIIVNKIDKEGPTIEKTEVNGKEITITAKDDKSGLKEYAITKTTEEPVEWSTSNVIKVTEDGTFYVWAKDNVGNITISESPIVVDTIVLELEITGNVTDWTNQNVELVVKANKALSSLKMGETQIDLANPKVVIEENGDYEFVATDLNGNETKQTVKVTKIDKNLPVISEVVNEGKDITITATDEISGVKEYAITSTTEEPVKWSKSNVIKVTEDGIFYAWVKDNAGNVSRAENAKVIDTTAPTVTFNYLSQTVTVGMPVEANVVTNEDAIISYSWDKETWVNSEELISRLTVSEKTTTPGKYTLYVKAKDAVGNESKVQSLEFEVTTIEEIKQPDIIFEDIPTIQVNGARYVKVSSQMTTELLTDSMNKEALCGKTPEYINLTEDGKLRTGSEITINGKTKYIVVVNGDVDGDGKVTFLGDIVEANDFRIGIGELTTIQMLAADINNNGKIEFISDIVAMNDYRLGIINSL